VHRCIIVICYAVYVLALPISGLVDQSCLQSFLETCKTETGRGSYCRATENL